MALSYCVAKEERSHATHPLSRLMLLWQWTELLHPSGEVDIL
jgi:hypothetical protein